MRRKNIMSLSRSKKYEWYERLNELWLQGKKIIRREHKSGFPAITIDCEDVHLLTDCLSLEEWWKVKIPKDITVEQAVDHCRNRAPDRENYWLVVWGLEDVRSEAEKSDLKLTDEQARQVLQYFSHHYDYVWEVSWELMSLSIKEVLGIERET